eukprot:SM000024S07824  [mRNA]  locus=s24:785840:786728:+ [translate_table: standard]
MHGAAASVAKPRGTAGVPAELQAALSGSTTLCAASVRPGWTMSGSDGCEEGHSRHPAGILRPLLLERIQPAEAMQTSCIAAARRRAPFFLAGDTFYPSAMVVHVRNAGSALQATNVLHRPELSCSIAPSSHAT